MEKYETTRVAFFFLCVTIAIFNFVILLGITMTLNSFNQHNIAILECPGPRGEPQPPPASAGDPPTLADKEDICSSLEKSDKTSWRNWDEVCKKRWNSDERWGRKTKTFQTWKKPPSSGAWRRLSWNPHGGGGLSRLSESQCCSEPCVQDSRRLGLLRVLVLQPGVRPEPFQDIGPPETSRPHVISNGKSSPRDLYLNAKTQLHSTTSKLQCWTPYAKKLAR